MKTLKKIDTTTELKKKKARRSLIKVMNDNCSAKQIINISIQYVKFNYIYHIIFIIINKLIFIIAF